MATILIVDDEKNTREGLELALEDKHDIYLAKEAEEAFRLMKNDLFDIILTDLRMAGKSGMKVIDEAMKLPNKPICIMMTAYGNIEVAVDAMKRGAFDFLTKPINIEKLEILIERALHNRSLKEENKQLHQRLDEKFYYSGSGIIGDSKALQKVITQVETVANAKTTVLLEGETGTGKELIAQMLHQNSPRAREAFIPVHCAALPTNLLESELFGHEKGAFTGASEKRIGRFESANKGTLFLDEIGEVDMSTQVKLLRFLETKTIERLGSMKPIGLDIRLVCATNRNLQKMVREGTFREDLLYRLNVVNIHIPPLRERKEDIPQLLDHYLHFFSEENGLRLPVITEETIHHLLKYDWPGNIRELRNFVENIVVLHPGANILPSFLDAKFTHNDPVHLTESLDVHKNEAFLLKNALEKTNGNKTKAAELLGVSRRTIHRKLKAFNLE